MTEKTDLAQEILACCYEKPVDECLIALAAASSFVLESALSQSGTNALPIFLRLVIEQTKRFQLFMAEDEKEETTLQ